jgi:regulator of RNase E activity RraB
VIRGRAPHYGKFTRTFPDDADGDALFQVASLGSDLSEPMEIDFVVKVPDQAAGQKVARAANAAGYVTEVATDDEGDWITYCTKEMVATYEAVVDAQEELRQLSSRYGGEPDGWETLGNAPDDYEAPSVTVAQRLGGRGGW